MQRPFILLNMAMTADGKIATGNRRLSSIGSQRDHEHLLELRTTADAVMAGARTVDMAKVDLGPGGIIHEEERVRRGLNRFNLRIVVSGSGTVTPCAHIFSKRFSPIIILTTSRVHAKAQRALETVADAVMKFGTNSIDFPQACHWLHTEWNVKRLLCEGGGELNDALLRAGLVDEIHLTICPKIFGGRHAPSIADGIGFPRLQNAAGFAITSTRRVEDEMFVVLQRSKPEEK